METGGIGKLGGGLAQKGGRMGPPVMPGTSGLYPSVWQASTATTEQIVTHSITSIWMFIIMSSTSLTLFCIFYSNKIATTFSLCFTRQATNSRKKLATENKNSHSHNRSKMKNVATTHWVVQGDQGEYGYWEGVHAFLVAGSQVWGVAFLPTLGVEAAGDLKQRRQHKVKHCQILKPQQLFSTDSCTNMAQFQSFTKQSIKWQVYGKVQATSFCKVGNESVMKRSNRSALPGGGGQGMTLGIPMSSTMTGSMPWSYGQKSPSTQNPFSATPQSDFVTCKKSFQQTLLHCCSTYEHTNKANNTCTYEPFCVKITRLASGIQTVFPSLP